MEEKGEPQPSSEGRKSGEPPAVGRPPRFLRVRLWQAIAGMSVAVALASLIVISELAGSLARRTNYVNRRVAALNATVRDLRHQTAVTQRKLGSERERATVGEVFEKILFAPDLRTIKLAAPAEKDKEKDKSIAQSGGPGLPSGRLAMSESAGAAMLEANGLKPTGAFEVYRIWWPRIFWSATTALPRFRWICRPGTRKNRRSASRWRMNHTARLPLVRSRSKVKPRRYREPCRVRANRDDDR
jgi:hypothetical protein